MPRLPAVLLVALAIALLALACGGDDGSTGPGETPAGTKPAQTSASRQPGAGGDEKTPIVEETSGDTETPNGQAPGATARPPASEGTPAVAPDDQVAFLSQFIGRAIDYEDCAFNPSTVITNCPGRGRYAVDPPLVGQDITCRIGLVDGAPVLIVCSSADPLQTVYYEIR